MKNKAKTEDEILFDFLQKGLHSNQLIDKILSTLLQKQELISRQLEESEKKFNQRIEDNRRFIQESEKKFFLQMEEKNKKINERAQEPEENISGNNKNDKKTKEKNKNKKDVLSIEPDDQNNYTSFFKLCREKGWKIHGAIVGSQFTEEEKQEILKAGFFLIGKYGDSYILDITSDFSPKNL